MNLAPVALFVYNRLDHTKLTLEALSKNLLSEKTDVFIFSDNFKSEDDKAMVESVRDFLISYPKNKFKSLTIKLADTNNGLAKSIINGVTSIVNKYGQIIVLEDDIVTSPYFLDYMNKSLVFYQKKKDVFHIGSWTYPILFESEDPFLWRTMNCWGWATWSDRWNLFEKNTDNLVNSFSKEMIYKFNLDGVEPFWNQVLGNHNGRLNTWAIFWYATIFKNNGLCLTPSRSLVENIGFDGSGTNCDSSLDMEVAVVNCEPNIIFPKELKESTSALNEIKKYYRKKRKFFIIVFLKKLYNWFLSKIKFFSIL